ncbi:acyl-CoA dehydrogenase family protein [Alcaligenaceae bacterium]|nr:acyl-CoA dehydrogenase family protein [Alcaligenaceae bacterium]
MDFTYNEEQSMFADSVRRLVADGFSFEQRRKRAKQQGLDKQAWQSLADLGVAGLLVPAEYEGFGESPSTLVLIQSELGRGLVAEPVIPSAVMATALILNSGNEQIKTDCLPAMAAGEMVCALAYLEPDQRNQFAPVSTQAAASTDGFVLNGKKKLVWQGSSADKLIVSAVLNGETALLLVPADAAGLALQDYPTIDGYRCANIQFDNVAVPAAALIAKGKAADQAIAMAIDYGITAICAHAAGAMERLTEITTDYLRTRQQFGRPLADFQALQHRLADMLLHKELAVSMAYVAATALGETDPDERNRLLSSAKVKVAEAGRFVGESAVQMHGGIGMTDELDVGDYFKRLRYTDFLLGDTDFHLSRLEAIFDRE